MAYHVGLFDERFLVLLLDATNLASYLVKV